MTRTLVHDVVIRDELDIVLHFETGVSGATDEEVASAWKVSGLCLVKHMVSSPFSVKDGFTYG